MKHFFGYLSALVLGCTCAFAATFTVTNTNDSGAGSLRQAIIDANNALGPHVINFNIPGTGPFTISPATEFPALGGQQIEINGLSQPSATCGAPLIVINGASAPMSSSGLILNRAGHVVKGLVINGFSGIGIGLSGTGGHTLSCNFIGTNAAGTAAVANGNGISVQPGSDNNRIGLAGAGNLIAGNRGYGIRLEETSGNVLLSNIIGLNATGTAAVGNTSVGVDIFSSTNTTIGTGTSGRNVISGNSASGIKIRSNSNTTTVLGNYIGTNSAGTAAIANFYGIEMDGSSNNTIGNATAGNGNVISGNGFSGVAIIGSNGNSIKNNIIGLNAAGSASISNNEFGVEVVNSSNNTIGGITTNEGNQIGGNRSAGVRVSGTGTGNSIRGNGINANGSLGIDLGAAGVTANDVGDGDTGANNLQNYPVISNTFTNAILGSINSTPNTVLIIDVYDSPAADPSAHGEGEVYRTSVTVTTDASGNAAISIGATFVPGRFVTMTATDPAGNTSEFARSEVVRNVMPVTLLTFEAKVVSNQARLTWTTTEELNNDRFEIERATDALNWLKIGTVKGFGSTNVTNTYQFIDESPETGTSYYRFKQVDFDGRFTHSPIKALSFEENFSERLTAYPNPTANGSVIIVLDQILEASAATVLSQTGAKLNNTPLRNLTPNKITIDLSAQPPGVYLVNINGKSVKVLKQ